MWRLIALIVLGSVSSAVGQEKPIDVPVSDLGSRFRLVGKLHIPLGEVVAVQGVIAEGPFKGYEGGPNLRVQRINGRATQEDIQIKVVPYFGQFGEKIYNGRELPKLENGATYEFEGYETGGYIGKASEAYQRASLAIQTTGYYFRQLFEVYKAKKIDPMEFSPAEFVGREALFQGKAKSEGQKSYIVGTTW